MQNDDIIKELLRVARVLSKNAAEEVDEPEVGTGENFSEEPLRKSPKKPRKKAQDLLSAPIQALLKASPAQVFSLFREEKLTLEQAKPYALKACEQFPRMVVEVLGSPELLSVTNKKKFAKLALEEDPGLLTVFYKKGLYSEAEAKLIAFRILKQYPAWGRKYIQRNFLTPEEVSNVTKRSV